MLLSRERLIADLDENAPPHFFFFWGHKPKTPSVVDASCLSQWFPARFEVSGASFATAEHYMMAEKARLFGDMDMLAEIVKSTSPAEAKRLGRCVKGYDDKRWAARRSLAVVEGNVAKFGQNSALGAFLLSTHDRVLVEASPRDRIWGIGMGASNPDARDPRKWRGANLLGFALMAARDQLRTSSG